jgi:uncharacterized membrane protein
LAQTGGQEYLSHEDHFYRSRQPGLAHGVAKQVRTRRRRGSLPRAPGLRRIMKAWIVPAVAAILMGCASRPEAPSSGGAASPVVDCGTLAFHAALRESQATLYLPGLAMSLPRTKADQGQRYRGNGYELWRRNGQARVRTPEQRFEQCRISQQHNAWADAWLRGVRFRAFGHEPGWILEIGRGRQLKLQWDYGEKQLTTTVPQASLSDDLVIYRSRTEQHELRVEILEHACRDSGKGEEHSHAVRVFINERTLHGCGRGLAPVEAGP